MSLRAIGSGRSAIATLGKLVFNLFFYFNSSGRGNTNSVVETNKPQLSTGSSMAIRPVHGFGQNRFTPQTNPWVYSLQSQNHILGWGLVLGLQQVKPANPSLVIFNLWTATQKHSVKLLPLPLRRPPLISK
jgi:hypothetical protein